mmetsp:Transcript_35941/g.43292  ORF Transcript_35941/g.43292 Transcript_35941/m.43292 type:complete len:578 (-) Transcript_35941:252-1985(-)
MASLVEKIIEGVIRGCSQSGIECTKFLAAFVARTIIDGDDPAFVMDKAVTEADVESLILKAISKISEKDSPSLETIKMQVSFDSFFLDEAKRQEELSINADKISDDMRENIAEMGLDCQHHDPISELQQSIFNYVLRTSPEEAGDRTYQRAREREIAAAIESVFPRIGIRSFFSLTKEEKKSQLEELNNIVLGIRLFNRDIGKGGLCIPHLHNDCKEQTSELLDIIVDEVDSQSKLCEKYQEILARTTLTKLNISDSAVKRWKNELVNRRQLHKYMQITHQDVHNHDQNTGILRDEYISAMESLKSAVGQRSSVVKELVYPKFYNISQLWMKLSKGIDTTKHYSNSYRCLCEYKNSYNCTIDKMEHIIEMEGDILQELNCNKKSPFQLPPPNAETEIKIETYNSEKNDDEDHYEHTIEDCILLQHGTTPDFENAILELQGFCPISITQNGMAVPGKPEHGIVSFKGRNYVFADEEAMRSFLYDPSTYLQKVVETAKEKPELINLLHLKEQFPNFFFTKDFVTKNNLMRKIEAETQTPVHFTESYIDPLYSWNEWDLRREVIKLANIRRCKTSSQQTV